MNFVLYLVIVEVKWIIPKTFGVFGIFVVVIFSPQEAEICCKLAFKGLWGCADLRRHSKFVARTRCLFGNFSYLLFLVNSAYRQVKTFNFNNFIFYNIYNYKILFGHLNKQTKENYRKINFNGLKNLKSHSKCTIFRP